MEGLFPSPYPKVPKERRVRTTPMQVLCLGLSRTATMCNYSMPTSTTRALTLSATYAGLKKLGYSTYHFSEMGLDAANDSLKYWTEATNAKLRGKGVPYKGTDFDKILWRYEVSITEWSLIQLV